VIEAAQAGTPSVLVGGPDNAAAELIEEGVNGFVVPSASAEDLADAIVRAADGGLELRASSAAWFANHAVRLSLNHSLEVVLDAYGHALPSASAPAAVSTRS
jgi:glycosyltransferase involved in cell wall biosynthesis